MKKRLFYFATILFTTASFAQAEVKNFKNASSLANNEFADTVGKEVSGIPIEGSNYLFDTWKNQSLIVAGEKKYKINNLNYNIKMQRFESELENKSIFVYDLNSLSKIIIAGQVFKTIYSHKDAENIIYEVMYETDQYSFLKTYKIKVVEGSTNPMVNRSSTKIKKVARYHLLKKGNALKQVKLKKKDILKALTADKETMGKLETFMKSKRLSFSKSEDITKLLKYLEEL